MCDIFWLSPFPFSSSPKVQNPILGGGGVGRRARQRTPGASRASKFTRQRTPGAPRGRHDGPRGPRFADRSPQAAQDGPKTAPEATKTATRRPQDGPRGSQDCSKTSTACNQGFIFRLSGRRRQFVKTMIKQIVACPFSPSGGVPNDQSFPPSPSFVSNTLQKLPKSPPKTLS